MNPVNPSRGRVWADQPDLHRRLLPREADALADVSHSEEGLLHARLGLSFTWSSGGKERDRELLCKHSALWRLSGELEGVNPPACRPCTRGATHPAAAQASTDG